MTSWKKSLADFFFNLLVFLLGNPFWVMVPLPGMKGSLAVQGTGRWGTSLISLWTTGTFQSTSTETPWIPNRIWFPFFNYFPFLSSFLPLIFASHIFLPLSQSSCRKHPTAEGRQAVRRHLCVRVMQERFCQTGYPAPLHYKLQNTSWTNGGCFSQDCSLVWEEQQCR